MRVGGKIDRVHFKPITVTGKVRLISQGKFRFKGPSFTGVEAEMGRTVVLDINNIHLVLMEKSVSECDPELYRSVGIEPEDMKIIVVKSPNLFRAAYEPIAKEVIWLDTPGFSSANLSCLAWKHIKRPVWPLDEFRWTI